MKYIQPFIVAIFYICVFQVYGFAGGFEQQIGQLRDTDGNLPDRLIALYQQNGMRLYVYEDGYDMVLYRNLDLPKTLHPKDVLTDFTVSASRVSVKWDGSGIPNVLWKMPQASAIHYYTETNAENGYHPGVYQKIELRNVYPGIHLEWQITEQGAIKYEWHADPGADISQIRWRQQGAKLRHTKDKLIMELNEGRVEDVLGVVYHTKHTHPIHASWKAYEDQSFGFHLEGRDINSGLVIDPGIVWSTYYGSPDVEVLTTMKVHADGKVTSGGFTTGTQFPVMQAFQQTFNGNLDGCVFQLDASGQRLWSTYFGGSGFDRIHDLAINAAGDIVICGETSANIPVSPGAYQAVNAGSSDAFAASFNPQGLRNWSTHFGGSSDEYAYGICFDQQNRMYITGGTYSSNLPVQNGYQPNKAGSALTADAFLVQFTISGTPGWGTFIGGNDNDFAYAIASDPLNRIVITGATGSAGFPVLNATQPLTGGGSDIFVSQFNTLGQLQWSTFMGGSGNETAEAITTDAQGGMLVGGFTDGGFPIQNAFQNQYGGGSEDMILISINGIGQVRWSGYYGGGDDERITDIAVDSVGQWLVVGYCTGNQFPVYYADQSNSAGNDDAVYMWLQADGVPVWASYLGGSEADYAYAGGIGAGRQVYVGGLTSSINFPVLNALQGQNATNTPQTPNQDIFISRFCQSSARISGNYGICTGGVELPVQLSGNGPWLIIYTDGNLVYQVTGITSLPYSLPVSPTASTTYHLIQSFDLSGCKYGYVSGSATVQLTQALPGLTISGTDTICPGATANLAFQLSGPGPWDIQYSDGVNTLSISGISVSPHIVQVNPAASVTYTPVSVESACGVGGVSGSRQITIDAVALPDAALPPSLTLCPGALDSVGVMLSGAQPWNVHWSDGTQNFSLSGISSSPVYIPIQGTYGNVYTLTSVENVCGSKSLSSAMQIDTFPMPVATWFYVRDTLKVSFTDQSLYALQWFWSFGDGITDTIQNPTHTYLNAGSYTVQCIVTNACGSDTLTQEVVVSIPVSADGDAAVQNIRIFPNPASGIFYMSGDFSDQNIEVYDVQGRQVPVIIHDTHGILSVEMITPQSGIYFVRTGMHVHKIQVWIP